MNQQPSDETRPGVTRAQFATRLPRALLREFKLACVLRDVQMQTGVEEALRLWIETDYTPDGEPGRDDER